MSERYHPNADQVALAASIGESIAAILPPARLHRLNQESGTSWAALNELGVFDIPNSGLGAIEEALIVLELGKRAVAPSVLATIGATHLLGDDTTQHARRVAAGYRRAQRLIVMHDADAELVLLRSSESALLCKLQQSGSTDSTGRVLMDKLWSGPLHDSDRGMVKPSSSSPHVPYAQPVRAQSRESAAPHELAQSCHDDGRAHPARRTLDDKPSTSPPYVPNAEQVRAQSHERTAPRELVQSCDDDGRAHPARRTLDDKPSTSPPYVPNAEQVRAQSRERTASRELVQSWQEEPATTPGSRVLDDKLWSCALHELAAVGGVVAEASADQLLRLRLLDAAALAGIAKATLDMAVHFAQMREQFGRPIGSFQAIKHHCANMALAARTAADQLSFAAVALDEERDDAALQVESALYIAGTAALDNCAKNIQIHGGIGFSDEAEPHLFLKRAHLYLELAGGLEAALERIGDIPPRSNR